MVTWYIYKVVLRPFLTKKDKARNYVLANKFLTLKLAKDMCSVIWFIEDDRFRIKSVKIIKQNNNKLIECLVSANTPAGIVSKQISEAPFEDTVWESDGYDFEGGWVMDCRQLVSIKRLRSTRAPKPYKLPSIKLK